MSYCFSITTFFTWPTWVVDCSCTTKKEAIRSTTDGFGKYEPAQNGSRARHLNSAKATIEAPDEVWEGNPKSRGRWVYLKEFDDSPYPFSVAIITNRDDGTIVPKTSFPCRRSDINGWRRGVDTTPKQLSHPVRSGCLDSLRGLLSLTHNLFRML